MTLSKKKADIWSLVTLGGFAIVIVFLIYPLADVFKYSFVDKETGAFSMSNWKEFFSRAYYIKAFVHSMVIALGTTFFAALLGIPLGFFTTRYKIRGTTLLTTLSVLALLSPTFIGAYSWITMLGNNGFLRNALASIGLKLPAIYGPAGIILADALQYYPFISLMLAGSLMTIDRSLEEASENLGARSLKTFFSVTLPLVLPSLTGGALIVLYDVPVELRYARHHRRQLPRAGHGGVRTLHQRDQREPGHGIDRLHRPDDVRRGRHHPADLGVLAPQVREHAGEPPRAEEA